MTEISKARIAILATDGHERSELREPRDQLRARGARGEVISPKQREIGSWDKDDRGGGVPDDRAPAEAEWINRQQGQITRTGAPIRIRS